MSRFFRCLVLCLFGASGCIEPHSLGLHDTGAPVDTCGGSCGADQQCCACSGCEPIDVACPTQCPDAPPGCAYFQDPVCGECALSWACEGECHTGPGGECEPGSYCDYETCGDELEKGTCEPRPNACNRFCDGACGCDGNMYCNACEAARTGIDVAPDSLATCP